MLFRPFLPQGARIFVICGGDGELPGRVRVSWRERSTDLGHVL